MKKADRKKISRLRRLYKNEKKTTLAYPQWVLTFFWDASAKQQLNEFLHQHLQSHGSVTSVVSGHPVLGEHTPIHLPYLYRHDLSFEDGSGCILFQKFNFTWNLTSLFASFTWSYLAQLSPTFRSDHRRYEKNHRHAFLLLHPPKPKHLVSNSSLPCVRLVSRYSCGGEKK